MSLFITKEKQKCHEGWGAIATLIMAAATAGFWTYSDNLPLSELEAFGVTAAMLFATTKVGIDTFIYADRNSD